MQNAAHNPKFRPKTPLQQCNVVPCLHFCVSSGHIFRTICCIATAIFLAVFCAVLLRPTLAFAEAQSDILDELQSQVDDGLSNLDFAPMDEVSQPFFPDFAQKVRQLINGQFDTAQSFWQVAATLFNQNLTKVLPQLVSVFCVLVICGLVRHTSGGFIGEDTQSVISFVGVTVVVISVLSLVVEVYKSVSQMLARISALSDAAFPILLTLVIANGGNVASSVCQPSMVMFSAFIIKLVQTVVLPLSVFGLAFVVVSALSDNLRIGKMCTFCNSASAWILGVTFMIFSAFTTVSGISATTVDGISYRAAKFAAKNYIPILGGYVSDGFDLIVAGTSLIKNSFGAVTMLLVFFITLQPLVTLVCTNLGLQAVAALAEPVSDDKYVKLLGGISKNLTFLSALVVAVAFMFCILALVAITTANF